MKTQPRQTKGQFLKSVRLHPKGTIRYTGLPSSELNFCPSRYTVVRPSTDEMGAVTLQSAPGNPTLQLQHSALWQRSKSHRFICVFTDQTSAVNVADVRKRISFCMCKDIFIVSAITLCFYFLKTLFNYSEYAICKICSALSSCAVCVRIWMCRFTTLLQWGAQKKFGFSLNHKKKNL